MKKSKAIALLTILTILIVVVSVFVFVPFKAGIYDYKSIVGGIKLGIDLKGGSYVVMEPILEDGEEVSKSDIAETIKIIQSRLSKQGYTEATVVEQKAVGQAAGVPYIRVEIPDVQDPTEVMNIIGKPAKLTFHKGPNATDEVVIEGKDVKKATFTMYQGGPAVAVTFTDAGAKKFSDLTQSMVGQQIGIAVDGKIISQPKVEEAITGGQTVISGMASTEEAKALAMQINSGSLPLTFKAIEPRAISATLGADALKNGLIAGGIGLALIFIFMAFVYKGLGLVANIALVIFTLLYLMLLAVLPVQLTIQGIAGIILSIGMAVDANVIIFERIKDEFKAGKSLSGSIKAGFKRATRAIIDANITTIIAALVLFIIGTGSIKGFGITLLIGILVSMFTSLVVTRFLIALFLPLTKKNKFYGVKVLEEVEEV